MNELKSVYVERTGDWVRSKHNLGKFYLKSEADEVIAELKKACKDKDDWCLHTLKELRHQKYKRCLAMARWCAKNVDHLNSEGYIYEKQGYTNELADCIKGTEFYHKWYNYWSKLVEKFKEAK